MERNALQPFIWTFLKWWNCWAILEVNGFEEVLPYFLKSAMTLAFTVLGDFFLKAWKPCESKKISIIQCCSNGRLCCGYKVQVTFVSSSPRVSAPPCLWVTPNSILQSLQELLPWAGAVCSWEGGMQDLARSAELEPVLCFHEITWGKKINWVSWPMESSLGSIASWARSN